MFRDPETGFWCDKLRLDRAVSSPCGPDNDFFSSAGTGMGLVSEAVMVELGIVVRCGDSGGQGQGCSLYTGYKAREEAIVNVVQTLTNLLTLWPREPASGFMVHFTHRCPVSSF